MKLPEGKDGLTIEASPPARGAGIEIRALYFAHQRCPSRPPRGGRGLQLQFPHTLKAPGESPPSRGAWIEISKFSSKHSTRTSPPSRGAWIEIGLRLTA